AGQGRALEVDFTAQQHGTDQVVVAGLRAADEATARAVEAAAGVVLDDRGRGRAPQAAGVETGVEARPLVVAVAAALGMRRERYGRRRRKDRRRSGNRGPFGCHRYTPRIERGDV